VIRGNHQAYCYLFADAKTQKTADRLKAFVKAKNGFELAEIDLAQRGAGDLAGIKAMGYF
jgi:ATP-dependent DNA helicase RecG